MEREKTLCRKCPHDNRIIDYHDGSFEVMCPVNELYERTRKEGIAKAIVACTYYDRAIEAEEKWAKEAKERDVKKPPKYNWFQRILNWKIF